MPEKETLGGREKIESSRDKKEIATDYTDEHRLN
jgi:hypothetical protein